MGDLFAPAPPPVTELARYRILSTTAGVRVSPLCLGAMSIGQAWASGMGSMDKEQAFKLLDAFFEAGGNFIDTANNYQNEESETWIGDWMKARNNRDNIVLATKYTTDYRSWELGKGGKSVNSTGNHRRSLHVSIRDSLKKLQTDWVDILYLHWWSYDTSIEEIMDSLHILVQQGKVLYLGISDSPAWVVSAANTYARAHGKTPFSVYQGRWNVMLRDFEHEIIPMANYFGMALCPFDVLGGGKFQSKKQLEERKKAGEGLRNFFGKEQSPDEEKISAALDKVAQEHGVESPTTIALAYIMQKTRYVFPIIGGRKVEHLKQNIQALSIRLSDKQVEYLESIIPFQGTFPTNILGPDPHISGKSSGLVAGVANIAWQKYGPPIGPEQ